MNDTTQKLDVLEAAAMVAESHGALETAKALRELRADQSELVEAARWALEALKHGQPQMNHYASARDRHLHAIRLTKEALAKFD